MNDLYNILNGLQSSKQRTVISTIIDVTGSSYRKSGAMMLYQEDGTQIGLLSGGCIENDLAERAEGVIEGKTSRSVVYDMKSEDEESWGQGSGCNGTITVLMEPVNDIFEHHLKSLNCYLKQGISVYHIKKLSTSGTVLGYIFITQNEEFFGEWEGDIPFQLNQLLSEHKYDTLLLANGSGQYFIQVFTPKPRLIIFGAGPDVRTLVDFAAQIGFSITITDWRPAFCDKTHFPKADDIVLEFPSSFLKDFPFSPNDFVLIMTHNFQKDQNILKILLEKKLQYLGVLGPRKRTIQLLGGQEFPDWLHSPVGLPIGAEGPEEIAISIIADLINTVRK